MPHIECSELANRVLKLLNAGLQLRLIECSTVEFREYTRWSEINVTSLGMNFVFMLFNVR